MKIVIARVETGDSPVQPSAATRVSWSKVMKSKPKGMGLGIALGAALGAALGVAAGHLAIWLAIGVAIGMAIGSTTRGKETQCVQCAAFHQQHESGNLRQSS